MGKNKQIILILILFNSFCSLLFAQDLYSNLSKEICECIEKENVKSLEEMNPCFENVIIDNLREIKAYYNVATLDEIDMDELGNKLGARLINECKETTKLISTEYLKDEPIIEKQENLTCDELKQGDFYYLTKRINSNVSDTTYVTISNQMFLERMNYGKNYSLLNIIWKDDCKFDLEFKESNDPFKKELSKPGDIYQYEIITNDTKSVKLKLKWKQEEYQIELFKLE